MKPAEVTELISLISKVQEAVAAFNNAVNELADSGSEDELEDIINTGEELSNNTESLINQLDEIPFDEAET